MHAEAATAIEDSANNPGGDVSKLEAALADTGLGDDPQVRAAAEVLLAKLELNQPQHDTRIDARGAKGVQIGDRNTQTNTFG